METDLRIQNKYCWYISTVYTIVVFKQLWYYNHIIQVGNKKQRPVVLYLWTSKERVGGERKQIVVLAVLLNVSLAFYQQLLVGQGSHLNIKTHYSTMQIACSNSNIKVVQQYFVSAGMDTPQAFKQQRCYITGFPPPAHIITHLYNSRRQSLGKRTAR